MVNNIHNPHPTQVGFFFCLVICTQKGVFDIKKGDVVGVWAQPESVHSTRYAFSPFKISVPVRILEEYPKWYLGLVLPHKNPSGFGGKSHPYRITIPKYDIETGFVKIKKIKKESFGT